MSLSTSTSTSPTDPSVNVRRHRTTNNTTFAQNPKSRRLPLSTSTPKTAFEKAIFRLNATTSPLLRLPSELRNRIWSLVLGERVVHVRREFWYHPIKNGRLGANRQDALRGRGCRCPLTEKGLFENYMTCLKTLRELEMETETDDRGEESDLETFNLDFSVLDGPDVLETFDFDSFLNQSGGDDMHGEGLGDELAPDAGGEGEVDGGDETGLDPSGLTEDHRDQEQIPNQNIDTSEHFDFDTFFHQSREDSRRTLEFPDHHSADGNLFVLPDSLPTLRARHQKRAVLDALDSTPHSACIPGSGSGSWCSGPRSKLSLHILGACRQVYGEARAVFWRSTTFFFSSPDDLNGFLKARALSTTAMITKMHVDVVSPRTLAGWSQSFQKWLVSSLRGLRVVHIHVSADYLRSHRVFVDELLEAFAPVGRLALRDVTVVIRRAATERRDDLPADEYVESIERVRATLMGSMPVGAV